MITHIRVFQIHKISLAVFYANGIHYFSLVITLHGGLKLIFIFHFHILLIFPFSLYILFELFSSVYFSFPVIAVKHFRN